MHILRFPMMPALSMAMLAPAGNWQANTAYLLNLKVRNPKAPASTTPQNTQIPQLWLLPLTYKQVQSGRVPGGGVQLVVRGSKYGQLCKLRYAEY